MSLGDIYPAVHIRKLVKDREKVPVVIWRVNLLCILEWLNAPVGAG